MEKVFLYMLMVSDGSAPSIVPFEDKEDCLKYLNKEIDRLAEDFSFSKEDAVNDGADSWEVQTEDFELTFSITEMDIVQKQKARFFHDHVLAESVNLTEEEVTFFDNLEFKYYKESCFGKQSGGYARVRIDDSYMVDVEGEDGQEEECLMFSVIVGIDGGDEDYAEEDIYYYRKDKSVRIE